jgi:mannose-1-phosphate guanylyltransferase
VLEDAEIQQHSYIINSMIGWNSKIGPWCRIEGTLFSDERSKLFYGQKFDVSVLGVGVVVEPEVMLRNCLVMPFLNVKENNANRIIF